MNPIDQLLKLQEFDTVIREGEREARDIPARKQQETARLDAFKKRVEEAQRQLKACEAELKQQELEVKSRQEKINKLRQQQLELKSNKEFKAVETEVEVIEHDIGQLEDRQLGLMDKIDAARKSLGGEATSLKEQETSVLKDIKLLDERLAEMQVRLGKIKNERALAAKDVPAEFLQPYERVLAHKDLALVPLQNGVCGGCHMTLPPAVLHETRKRKALVSCGYCVSLLY